MEREANLGEGALPYDGEDLILADQAGIQPHGRTISEDLTLGDQGHLTPNLEDKKILWKTAG